MQWLTVRDKGTIPTHWLRYKIPKAMSVAQWVPDFVKRIAQLDKINNLNSLHNVEVWLGGLFFPEAYVTATRQAVAHRKKWSLETLYLELDIEQIQDPNAFIIEGMRQEDLSSPVLTSDS
jgi:dynein heavy chain 1